jgi:histidine decarboxylase
MPNMLPVKRNFYQADFSFMSGISSCLSPHSSSSISKRGDLQMVLKREDLIKGAIGPFDDYADGYGNPGTSGLGYISVLKLETGKVKADMDKVLEGIVSYDRAETNGSYIGQINMIAASSFNGLNGLVWGYDIAKHESIANGTLKPLFERESGWGKDPRIPCRSPLRRRDKALWHSGKKTLPDLAGSSCELCRQIKYHCRA